MAKFKIGDELKLNNFYKEEYRKIFGKDPKDKGGIVKEIYEDTKYDTIYFFTELDEHGNKDGIAEQFLELV